MRKRTQKSLKKEADDLWGNGLMSTEGTFLDRFIYRGRGRPRKTDYSTVSLLQKKVNAMYGNMIEEIAKGL